MGSHWFIYKNQKQKGPYTWQQLWREAQAGRLSPRDLVWNKTMKDWIQASQVPGLIYNTRKRNYLAIALVTSAAFFLLLSGTAFYYLFFYTGPQLSAIGEQEEPALIEEPVEENESEDPGPDVLEEYALNNRNESREQETASANNQDNDSDDEPDQSGFQEQTIPFQGGTYTGPLKEGEPHGYGVWTHPDGHHYEGDFRNGSIEGYGTMTFPGGERYTGYLKDGKAHGGGTMTHPDGRQVSGQWVEGVYQDEDADEEENDDAEENDDEENNNET